MPRGDRRSTRPTKSCSPASGGATATRSETSTSATRARCSGSRCAGSATAAAPRTRCRRRSRRSGARRRRYQPRARTGRAVAVRRRAQRDRRPRPRAARAAGRAARRAADEAGPPERAEQAGSPGACTARSRTLPGARARACSSSPTGAGCRRARSPSWLEIPLGTVKTRTRSGARPSGGRAGRGAEVTNDPDFHELVGDDGDAGGARRGSGARTTCWSRPARRPSSRPRSRTRPTSKPRRSLELQAPPAGDAARRRHRRRRRGRVRDRLRRRRPTTTAFSAQFVGARCTASARLGAAHASIKVGDHDSGGQLAAAR